MYQPLTHFRVWQSWSQEFLAESSHGKFSNLVTVRKPADFYGLVAYNLVLKSMHFRVLIRLIKVYVYEL